MLAPKDGKAGAELSERIAETRRKPGLALAGLLVLEIIIGYEWLVSGLTKFVLGDFPAGLADELANKSPDVPAWYGGFFNSIVIPHAVAFGYVIEFAELLVGLALIVGPLLWLFAWRRLPSGLQTTIVFLMTAASVGGILMALNFHLANGTSHPWLIPQDSFEEGIDFDSLLAILNIVTATVNGVFLSRLRETTQDALAAQVPLRQPQRS